MSPRRSTGRISPLRRLQVAQGGDEKVFAQAAGWLAGLDRGLSSEDQIAFRHWLTANGCHRQAWSDANRIWRQLDLLARGPARRRLKGTLTPRVRSILPPTVPDG